MGNKLGEDAWPNTVAAAKVQGAAVGDEIVNSVTFSAGLTIYGRWTGFTLASGAVVAYVGA